MKHILGIAIMLMLTVFFIFPAQVIDNPDKPIAKNAGRILKLTELLRISDEGGKFYFKQPHLIKVAPDGSIILEDDQQFLKFNGKGLFEANLQKKGEGPGEFFQISNYQFFGDRLKIIASQPRKVLEFDLSGKLIKETRLADKGGIMPVIELFKDKFYYLYGEINVDRTKSGTQEFDQKLFVSTYDGKNSALGLNFPMKWISEKVTFKGGISLSMRSIDRLSYAVENERSMFISHTENYLVKHVDLMNGKLISQFNRAYRRVVYTPGEEDQKPGAIKGNKQEYFPDIQGLSLNKGKLWVFTSTVDKKKGVLVDVFSLDGKYLDNFYLPLPGFDRPDKFDLKKFSLIGDSIYIVEEDEEGNPMIVKYKIEI